MSHIDKTIARIPTMKRKERAEWRRKVEATLRRLPKNADALRLREALDSFESDRPLASMLVITGALAWERHVPGESTFRAFHGDRLVGEIFKRDNHTAADKDVYSVTILGENLPGNFQYIEDARAAGEAAFSSRRSANVEE